MDFLYGKHSIVICVSKPFRTRDEPLGYNIASFSAVAVA
jgi:hypothetical protein